MNPPAPLQSRHAAPWRVFHAMLLDALFPPRCAGCPNWSRDPFCPTCAPQLKRVQPPFCAICSEPFDPLAYAAQICARCRAKTPHFEAARAAFEFEGPLREAIHRLKYRQKSALAPRLAPFLARAVAEDAMLCEFQTQFLVPVPLHPARRRGRGFNQSLLLARELSLLTSVPTRELLHRTRNTPPQVTLKGAERAKNVRDAFAACGDLTELQGAQVLLIDDVFTTGATLGEAAKVLRAAGAAQICALTLAR